MASSEECVPVKTSSKEHINKAGEEVAMDEVTQLYWPPRNIEVTYEIKYNENCLDKDPPTPLKIITKRGITGQEIMEIAAQHDSRYRFTTKYYNHELGYSVTTIDDVENNSDAKYYWSLYVGAGNDVSRSPVGITHWIPFPDSRMIWEYSK
jgi:hypothetical protein